MHLAVIYGLDTDDHMWLQSFYPAKRLSEECKDRGIQLRFFFIREIYREGDRAFIPGMSHHTTAVLIRGQVPPALVLLLENSGYRCINGSRALTVANDKWETYLLCKTRAFPVPLTELYTPGEQPGIPFPLIAKPRFGLRGRGVFLAKTEAELHSKPSSNGEPYIVQEWIQESRGRDLRLFFAGGRFTVLAVRESEGLVSNTGEGGVMRPARQEEMPTPELLERTSRLIRDAALVYGSADFLFTGSGHSGDRHTLCELNGSPGFEQLERSCRCNAAGAIIDAIRSG